MSYCKYCQNVLKIVKNPDYNPATVQLQAKDMISILEKKSRARDGQYVDDEETYQIDFDITELDKVNIDSKMFKDVPIDDVRQQLKDLYEEIVRGNKNGNMFNLLCNSCSATYYLRPGTTIDSNNFTEVYSALDEVAHIRVHDPTLFRTKNFICVNKKCISNTDKSDKVQLAKEAVFYKLNTHNIKYICVQCNTRWGT